MEDGKNTIIGEVMQLGNIKIRGESYFDEVLKYKTTPFMDKVFGKITLPIEQLLGSDVYNCLILCSEGGLGKTATALRYLDGVGLKEGEDFFLHTGKRTTIEIVELLASHNEALHVFDDVNLLTSDPDVIPFLKQAMQRGVLEWKSRLNEIKPTSFLGKTIIICNSIPGGLDVEALRQRCLIPFISFSREERLGVLRDFVEVDTLFPDVAERVKVEVLEYIEGLPGVGGGGLNFRLFKLGCDTARQFSDGWRDVFDLYYRSMVDLVSVAKSVGLDEWLSGGYGSRRNYFYLKKKEV